MSGLGAYYAWNSAHEPVQPITPVPGTAPSGLGAYYAWDSAHEPVLPVNGLGDSMEAAVVDEAARALLDKRKPLAVVIEWARQQTDTLWRELPPRTSLTLLPLAAADLKPIQQAAFGRELPTVAVFRKTPAKLQTQERAFEGTPYAAGLSLAVYSLADGGRVARPYFLTLATLRGPEDRAGGHKSAARAADALRGALVYPVSLPAPRGARPPGAHFQEVFAKIGAMGEAAAAPAAPAPTPASPTTPLSVLPYFLAGTLAAGGVWWFFTRR